jgi:hypothetical protein
MRKQFLINKEFQLKFIFFMITLAVVTLLANFFVFQSYFKDFMKLADESGLAANHPFRDLITYQKQTFNQWFLYIALFNFIVITVCGLWMSHKIAGPIYRIVQSLRNQVKMPIKTRKGDYFPELPDAINQYLEK